MMQHSEFFFLAHPHLFPSLPSTVVLISANGAFLLSFLYVFANSRQVGQKIGAIFHLISFRLHARIFSSTCFHKKSF